ncbi:metal-dependent hydrolase [Natrialbaceae archaeon A-CW2]
MADVLTHVLVGYVIGTCLTIRYDWMGAEHVTLVMIGALLPDLVKINLVVPDSVVAGFLGVPFSWSPIHTLGGTVVVILLGSLILAPEHRTRAIILMAIGAVSHHVLDVALLTSTGYSYAVFWPLTEYRPPSGDLYLSSDRWPALVAGGVAVAVWLIRRQMDSRYTPSGK